MPLQRQGGAVALVEPDVRSTEQGRKSAINAGFPEFSSVAQGQERAWARREEGACALEAKCNCSSLRRRSIAKTERMRRALHAAHSRIVVLGSRSFDPGRRSVAQRR